MTINGEWNFLCSFFLGGGGGRGDALSKPQTQTGRHVLFIELMFVIKLNYLIVALSLDCAPFGFCSRLFGLSSVFFRFAKFSLSRWQFDRRPLFGYAHHFGPSAFVSSPSLFMVLLLEKKYNSLTWLMIFLGKEVIHIQFSSSVGKNRNNSTVNLS